MSVAIGCKMGGVNRNAAPASARDPNDPFGLEARRVALGLTRTQVRLAIGVSDNALRRAIKDADLPSNTRPMVDAYLTRVEAERREQRRREHSAGVIIEIEEPAPDVVVAVVTYEGETDRLVLRGVTRDEAWQRAAEYVRHLRRPG